MKHDVI
jgi:HAMP domain-containing protein